MEQTVRDLVNAVALQNQENDNWYAELVSRHEGFFWIKMPLCEKRGS